MLKKILLTLGALIVVVLIAAGTLAYKTFGIGLPMKDGVEVGGGRVVLDGVVQMFLFDVGGGKYALIDAGIDPEAKLIKAELSRRGATVDSVVAIFVTHSHTDHVAGVASFPKAEVYAHEAEIPLLEGRVESRAPARYVLPAPNQAKVRATKTFRDGDVITVGSLKVKAFHTPGHTDGSTTYLANGVLFFGDSAVGAKDGSLAPAPWFFSNDTGENRRALAALAGRVKPGEVAGLAFAHSGSLTSVEPLLAFARAAH